MMNQQTLFNPGKPSTVPALSLRQPWAWAVAHAGKRIENRRWRTHYRGPLVIHAAKSRLGMTAGLAALEQLHAAGEIDYIPAADDLAFGQLVAIVELVDVAPASEHADNPWAVGPWCWVLDHVRVIEPVAYRGQQRLFRVDRSLIREC